MRIFSEQQEAGVVVKNITGFDAIDKASSADELNKSSLAGPNIVLNKHNKIPKIMKISRFQNVLMIGLVVLILFTFLADVSGAPFPRFISDGELQTKSFSFDNETGATPEMDWFAPSWMAPSGYNSASVLRSSFSPLGRELVSYNERKSLYKDFLNSLIIEYLREKSYDDMKQRLLALGANVSPIFEYSNDVVDAANTVTEGLNFIDSMMKINGDQLLSASGQAAKAGNWHASASALSKADMVKGVRHFTKPIEGSGASRVLGRVALVLEGISATIETVEFANESIVYVLYNALIAEETLVYLDAIMQSQQRGLALTDHAWVDALDETIHQIRLIEDERYIRALMTGFTQNFGDCIHLAVTWLKFGANVAIFASSAVRVALGPIGIWSVVLLQTAYAVTDSLKEQWEYMRLSSIAATFYMYNREQYENDSSIETSVLLKRTQILYYEYQIKAFTNFAATIKDVFPWVHIGEAKLSFEASIAAIKDRQAIQVVLPGMFAADGFLGYATFVKQRASSISATAAATVEFSTTIQHSNGTRPDRMTLHFIRSGNSWSSTTSGFLSEVSMSNGLTKQFSYSVSLGIGEPGVFQYYYEVQYGASIVRFPEVGTFRIEVTEPPLIVEGYDLSLSLSPSGQVSRVDPGSNAIVRYSWGNPGSIATSGTVTWKLIRPDGTIETTWNPSAVNTGTMIPSDVSNTQTISVPIGNQVGTWSVVGSISRIGGGEEHYGNNTISWGIYAGEVEDIKGYKAVDHWVYPAEFPQNVSVSGGYTVRLKAISTSSGRITVEWIQKNGATIKGQHSIDPYEIELYDNGQLALYYDSFSKIAPYLINLVMGGVDGSLNASPGVQSVRQGEVAVYRLSTNEDLNDANAVEGYGQGKIISANDNDSSDGDDRIFKVATSALGPGHYEWMTYVEGDNYNYFQVLELNVLARLPVVNVPASVAPDQGVVLSGSYFGTSGSLYVSGVLTATTSWSSTEVRFISPSENGVYGVQLANSAGPSNSVMLTVESAPIFSLQTDSGVAASASHNFGTVERGHSSGAKVFRLANTGNATLQVGDFSVASEIDISLLDSSGNSVGTQGVIGPGDYVSLSLTYTPSDLGADSHTFSFYTSDSDHAEVSLSLSGSGQDTTAPVITINYPSAESVATIRAVASASGSVTDFSPITLAYTVNGGSSTAITPVGNSWSIQDLNLVEGNNVVVVTGTDTSANDASDSVSFVYTIPYTLTLLKNIGEGGFVGGGGNYPPGSSVTAVAIANDGYNISEWKDGGVQVSTAENYRFNLTGNRTLTAIFTPDANPPSITSFTIDGGATETTDREVNLDNTTSGGTPTHYRAGENSDLSTLPWLIYSSSPIFTLSWGNGTKTVYLEVKNEDGSDLASDTITYAPPNQPILTSLSIDNGASTTFSQTVTLNHVKSGGTPTHYMASESPSFSGASWLTYTASPSFTLSAGTDMKTVYLKLKNADAESVSQSDTIVYDPTTAPADPPTAVEASQGRYTDMIRVTWNNVIDASDYLVYRNTSNSSSGATPQGGWQTGTTYDDTWADAGTTYYYWVKASKNGGFLASGFSNMASGYMDVGALVVTPNEPISILEGGEKAFTVGLSAQPFFGASVSVAFTSGDSDLSIKSGSVLTFTAENWMTPQSVVIKASEDLDEDDGAAVFTVSSVGLASVNLTVREVDNDTTLSVVAGTGGTVSPSGEVVVTKDVATPIIATPNASYEFVNWTVTSGSATIDNATAADTTATISAPATVTANFTNSRPEIVVEQPAGSEILDGGQVDFGAVVVPVWGTSKSLTFTVRNSGRADLTGLAITTSGTNGSEFSASEPTSTTVAPGDSTTFTVTFTPSQFGSRSRTAAIHIASNDADENPFDITLVGEVFPVPEVAVEQPAGTNLTDGSASISCGSVNLGSASGTLTFTIRNVGTAKLTGLAVTTDGANAADFAVGSLGATTVAAGSSTTFPVTFTPGAAGPRVAALHIASNDADENPFDINLTGTGVAVPEIIASASAVSVPEGGSATFQVKLSKAPATNTVLTVARTSGDSNVTVTGGASLTFTTSNWNVFQTVTLASAQDADTTNGTATITCSAAGLASVTVTATEADNDTTLTVVAGTGGTVEPSGGVVVTKDVPKSISATPSAGYTFVNWTVTSGSATIGNATAADTTATISAPATVTANFTNLRPEIVVEQPAGSEILDGGQVDFGAVVVPVWGTSKSLNITVRNSGGADLTGLAITKSGTNAGEFSVNGPTSTTVVGGDSTTFTVTFTPSQFGSRSRTAAIHIASNDADENPFDIGLVGEVFPVPEIAVEQPAGTNLTDGSASISCGSVNLGSASGTLTFTIRNDGTANLTGLVVIADGANAADFAVGSLGATTVAAGSSTTFPVIFTPGAAGPRVAALHIASNDADENPFDINLTGTGVAVPEIIASASAVSVPEGVSATFQVKLSKAPATNTVVTVARTSGDSNVTVTGGASLTFTTSTWDILQPVTLSAAQDADTTNGTATITCSAPGLASVTVTATEADNDTTLTVVAGPGGSVSPSGAVVVTKGAATPISAIPYTGYVFVNWTVTSGSAMIGDSTSASTTATITAPATVRASFMMAGYDDWIGKYPSIPVGKRGRMADADGDGTQNVVEYFQGTSPVSAAEAGGLYGMWNLSNGRFETSFLRSKTAAGVAGVVQWSRDLRAWYPGGAMVDGSSVSLTEAVVPGPGDQEVVTVTAVVSGAPLGRLFLRLEVEQGETSYAPADLDALTLQITFTKATDPEDLGTHNFSVTPNMFADGSLTYERLGPNQGRIGYVNLEGYSGEYLFTFETATTGTIVENYSGGTTGQSSGIFVLDSWSISHSVPVGFAAIPGGTFTMGSPDGTNGTTAELGRDSDETQHEVTLSSFLMKRTEVTNQELVDVLNWAEDAGKLTVSASSVSNAEGSSHLELVDLDDSDCRIRWNAGAESFELKDANYANHPAVEVSWYGALAWCNYRSDMEGSDRCYSFDSWTCDWTKNGYRLPTEAEWEYACRGGTTTAFHTGEISSTDEDTNMNAAGWYSYNSGSATNPVADPSTTGNAWGLFDMHGNVWEWCWDRYGPYAAGSQTDPKGEASGSLRVGRGGSWIHNAGRCRAADRSSGAPISSNGDVGFRPARGSVPYAAIPGGTFTMGSPDGTNGTPAELGRDSDETQHEVTVSSFFMKKTEVTNQELVDVLNWAEDAGKLTVSASSVSNAEGTSHLELVDLDDSDCRIRWNAGAESFELKDANYANHPAVEVSWYGALAWCNYRSDMEGFDRCYSFDSWACDWTKNGYRLPTEAEWEYACRGGTTTAFHTGEISSTDEDTNMNAAGWYLYNSGSATNPVADPSTTGNAWGLFDMHGNVWEWCWDRYGPYAAGSQTDPKGEASGSLRVGRGGSWIHNAGRCRAADRSSGAPISSNGDVGFRPARGSVP